MKPALAVAVLLTFAAGCGGKTAQTAQLAQTPELEQDAVVETLVVPAERYAVGDRYTIVEDFSFKSKIEPSSVESIRYDRNQDVETTFEILEVDGQMKVTRERVTFVIDDVRSILARKAQRETSVIAGKSYLVTRSGDTLTVTDDQGRTPPQAEVTEVRNSVRSDVDEALERMFGGRTWHIDQRVELGPDALGALNRAQRDPRTRYTSFAMELRSVADGVATFVVTLSFDQGTNNGPLIIKLTGTKDVEVATGRLLQQLLRGSVTGTLGGAPVTGEATMSIRRK